MISGYTVGGRYFDALILGYWEGDKLMDAARTRSGFTLAVREQLHQRFRGLGTSECPFANLAEARAGRWGDGLTARKMKTAQWRKAGGKKVGTLLGIPSKRWLLQPRINPDNLLIMKWILEPAEGLEPPTL